MAWRRLTVRVGRDDVARLESLLQLAGASSIALEDAEDAPLFEPSPGDTPLWPRVAVKALFSDETDAERLTELLAGALEEAEVAVEAVNDAQLRGAGGRQSVPPRRIGRGLWLTAADGDAPAGAADTLKLHMGLAFGTGGHPTTALCLDWIGAELRPGSVVLDYGCGSGVLALAALKLGAFRAFGVDNDPQALTAAARNAELNALQERLWVGLPQALPAFRADVVLANILSRPLIAMAEDFAARLVSGGRAVLSGVLAGQRADVIGAYEPYLDDLHVAEKDGWLRITGRRRPLG